MIIPRNCRVPEPPPETPAPRRSREAKQEAAAPPETPAPVEVVVSRTPDKESKDEQDAQLDRDK